MTKPQTTPMRSSIWRGVKHYTYGCFAKSWNAAIIAVYALLGQAAGAGLDPQHFVAPTWRTLAFTFAVAFAIQAVGYFKDNPLPDKLTDTSAPFATTTETTTKTTINPAP